MKQQKYLLVVLSAVSGEVRTHNLRDDASGSSLVSLSIVLNETKNGESRIELTGYISHGMHGCEESSRSTPVGSTRSSSAGKDESSQSFSDTLLDVDVSTCVTALGLGSRHPLVNFPGNGSSGNLASARHEAGDVIVGSAGQVANGSKGRIHSSSSNASRDGEGSADLHEVSIGSEDSGHEEEGSDDLGNICCEEKKSGERERSCEVSEFEGGTDEYCM